MYGKLPYKAENFNFTNIATTMTNRQSRARKVIEQHLTLKLSVEDSITFADALLNPPKPNDALKKAALRYKQVISVYQDGKCQH